MDGFGDQLLAGAAFALNENCGVGGRRVFDQLVDDPHLRVFADDVAESAELSTRSCRSRISSS